MLTVHEVLYGYTKGIFPMAHPEEDNAIYWYEPKKRGIIPLDSYKIPKNHKKLYNKGIFELKINENFEAVIRACSAREDTWISEEIIEVYCELHSMGHAFSFETWKNNELVGGLYGVAMGKAFFGESMFHKVTDASKIALVFLMETLSLNGFLLLDTQFITDHLKQFGAIEITQNKFKQILNTALQ